MTALRARRSSVLLTLGESPGAADMVPARERNDDDPERLGVGAAHFRLRGY
jgi:hypothetical protein